MALVNPNIAMSYRAPDIQPQNMMADYAALQQIRGGQQAQELNALKMQEAQASLQERNALRGLNPNAPDYEAQLFKVNPQLGIAFRKEASTAAAQEATRQKALIDAAAAKQGMMSQAYRDISGRPSDANIMAHTEDIQASALFSPQEKQKALATQETLLAMPVTERGAFLASQGAKSSELKPTMVTENLGGTSRVSAIPAFGGAPSVLSTAGKTATPGELLSNQVAKGQLAVSQGQLQVARDRLAKEGAGLDPTENAAVSKAILEGRLDPTKINGRNAKILATTLLSDPTANLLELGVSAAGATASERSLATQTAKMSTAANEANKMVDVVRGLSDKVDRGEFPSINAISNAVAKGTGGKEIVQLNTSINALVNSYARAISPTGQPTVSDKNHAREIINSAYSQGQLGAILDVMQQEMSIARGAAGTASTELKASREAARGRTSEVKLAPADQQALDWANANAKDPRAAQIKQKLGM